MIDSHTKLFLGPFFFHKLVMQQLFETFNAQDVTDLMLKEAAILFSENYGIWGIDPRTSAPAPKPGEPHKFFQFSV